MRILVMSAAVAAAMAGSPALAQSDKAEYCGHQGDIVAALTQARLDRVPEREAEAHVIANATWPEKYNVAVPLYVGEIYKLKRRVLKNTDMGTQWREACLAN